MFRGLFHIQIVRGLGVKPQTVQTHVKAKQQRHTGFHFHPVTYLKTNSPHKRLETHRPNRICLTLHDVKITPWVLRARNRCLFCHIFATFLPHFYKKTPQIQPMRGLWRPKDQPSSTDEWIIQSSTATEPEQLIMLPRFPALLFQCKACEVLERNHQ